MCLYYCVDLSFIIIFVGCIKPGGIIFKKKKKNEGLNKL